LRGKKGKTEKVREREGRREERERGTLVGVIEKIKSIQTHVYVAALLHSDFRDGSLWL